MLEQLKMIFCLDTCMLAEVEKEVRRFIGVLRCAPFLGSRAGVVFENCACPDNKSFSRTKTLEATAKEHAQLSDKLR